METWKSVVGYEGIYEVSDTGKIKSLDRLSVHKNGKKYNIKERILKDIRVGDYRGVQLCNNGNAKKNYLHRLVALHFVSGHSEVFKVVNHIDGDKNNNHFENLEWVTHSQNLQHALETGLNQNYGENSRFCKFPDVIVQQVKDLYDNGAFIQSEISEIYGISRMQIHRIVKRKLRILGGEITNEKIRINCRISKSVN